MKRLLKRLLLGIALLVTLAVAWLGVATEKYDEYTSPDGSYRVMVTKRMIYSIIPTMPGDGSSWPGRMTIYNTKTGKNYGTRTLSALFKSRDIEWTNGEAWLMPDQHWDLSE